MAYNEKHKQFLQYFMQHRTVPEDDTKKINNFLFPNTLIDNTIELINIKIAPLELKINKVVCEQNGVTNYVFIATFVNNFNTKQDPSKVIFSKIVKYIIEADGCVPYDELINFDSKITDTLLDHFFTNKYLIADKDKNIFLSPLAISELEGYLAEQFNEKRCMCCMSVVGHGIKCQSCKKYVHGHCLTIYLKNIGNEKCPKCFEKLIVQWNPITIVNQL